MAVCSFLFLVILLVAAAVCVSLLYFFLLFIAAAISSFLSSSLLPPLRPSSSYLQHENEGDVEYFIMRREEERQGRKREAFLPPPLAPTNAKVEFAESILVPPLPLSPLIFYCRVEFSLFLPYTAVEQHKQILQLLRSTWYYCVIRLRKLPQTGVSVKILGAGHSRRPKQKLQRKKEAALGGQKDPELQTNAAPYVAVSGELGKRKGGEEEGGEDESSF